MATAGLDALRLKQATATLRQIDAQITAREHWIRTLTSFKGNVVDAADLLKICNQIMQEAMQLHVAVAGLQAEARSLSRSLPKMPPKEIALGKFTASSGGELKDLVAIGGRVAEKLQTFHGTVSSFRQFALHKMNEPDRTSDGQPLDALGALLEILKLLLAWKKKL